MEEYIYLIPSFLIQCVKVSSLSFEEYKRKIEIILNLGIFNFSRSREKLFFLTVRVYSNYTVTIWIWENLLLFFYVSLLYQSWSRTICMETSGVHLGGERLFSYFTIIMFFVVLSLISLQSISIVFSRAVVQVT